MLKKIGKEIEKAIGLPYLFSRALFAKRTVKNNKVLIAENGHLGDALVDAGAIIALKNKYLAEGKEVYLLCPAPLWNLLQLIPGTEGIKVLPYAAYELPFSVSALKNMVKQLASDRYELIVGLGANSFSFFCFCVGLSGRKHLLTAPAFKNRHRTLFKLFSSLCDMVMLMEGKESRFLATERFLHSLGIAEYKGRAVRIQTVLNKKFCVEREYIAVVVDSANSARRWPEQHFSILIDQLLIRYKWDVYLLGVKARDEMKDVLEGLKVKYPGRLHDMVGKTSFNDWVAAIRDSKFLVGVDSGAVHVAASLGTRAFCLSGVWQGYNFFPYPPQVLCEGIVPPICIYMPGSEEAPCFNCTGKTGNYGTLNSKCHESYKKNEPCLCLQNIRPEQVLAVIEKNFPPADSR